jgi:UDP-glucose 4-epimerase
MSTPTLIGRLSNLYGGDQDLTKRQGFVSHICRSIALRKSFVLSVPADTQRDFLYADDAAARILGWFARPGEGRGPVVKILSAGRPRTLLDVIRVAGAVSGIHPRVVMAANPASRLQPRYLRFRSVVRTDLDLAHPARGLEVGTLSVWHHTLRARASGRLS